jgi:flagellar biosynthetic protein FlhB
MADEPDSDDRTEEPTQRKLDEAIKRGDVAKSQEINTLFVLGGFTLALMMLSGSITQALTVNLRAFLMNAHQVPPDGAAFAAVGRQALWAALAAAGLPALVIAIGGLLGGGLSIGRSGPSSHSRRNSTASRP